MCCYSMIFMIILSLPKGQNLDILFFSGDILLLYFFLLNTLMVRCLNIWMTFFHPPFGQILKSRNLVRGFTKSINHMLSIVIQKVYSHLHYQKCPLVQFPRAFDNIKIYSLLIYSNVVRNCHSCLNTCFFIRWLVIYNSYCVN